MNKLSRILHSITQKNLFQKQIDSKKTPLHFLHIGKTGGSAIKYALQEPGLSNTYDIILHNHEIALSDIPLGEKFFFSVRNPIDRFVSGFYSRLRQGSPKYKSPWSADEKKAFNLFSIPNELAEALSHADTDLKSEAQMAMKAIGHVNSSYWQWFKEEAYFMSRREDVFFVCHQNNLTKDFHEFKKLLDLKKDIALPELDSIHAHSNPAGLDCFLSDQARRNLSEWYKMDLRFCELVDGY
ncbi:MAG: sulfotransferase family 2 domain-containing protein [Reichenbachiella sp.]|uniref:sulfotransferase family 2 domain-containing protein n=1 Tax=Reichenbachiella sp. TaxID=2184521 RepID=UPI0032676B85